MSHIYKKDRRMFLVGAGKFLIALPFIPEILKIHSARAVEGAIPKRLMTLFYANGFPNKFADMELSNRALNPMKPFQNQLVFLKGVDAEDTGKGRNHDAQCMTFARGIQMKSPSQAGGPSLDYRASQALRDGSTVDLLAAGLGGNLESIARYVMSWRSTSNYERPHLNPMALFNEIFGSAAGNGNGGNVNSTENKKARMKNSILDAVLESYKSVSASKGEYSPETRSKISSHLERVREVERKVVEAEGTLREVVADMGYVAWAKQVDDSNWIKKVPDNPDKPKSLEYQDASNYEKGINYIAISEWDWVWPLMVEMYAIALHTNYTQFGSMVNGVGGERYFAPRSQFPNGLPSTSKGTDHHDYYHSLENDVQYFINWYMKRNAEVLKIFSRDDYKEANGKTLLENTPLFIGPELDQNHGTQNMTYMIAGGSSYFKAGSYDLRRRNTDVDVYNTILKALGVDVGGNSQDSKKFGDRRKFKGFLQFAK